MTLQDWHIEALRITRFGIVGLLSAAVYAAVATGLVVWTQHIILATILGQAVSTIVSYFGHLHFSFSLPPQRGIFLSRFLLLVGVAFGVNIGVTWLLSTVVSHEVSILVVTVLLPAVTYLASRFWVFLPGISESHGLLRSREESSPIARND